MSSFEITPLAAGQTRNWTVDVEHDDQGMVAKITLSSKWGTLSYGRRPEGFEGWAFQETGGGGATTVPYAIDDAGEIYLGLILENRLNMGGKRWCAIGGFKDPGESPLSAATRKALEEAGVTFDVRPLPGLPGNSNRLFFVADPEAGEGVDGHTVQIPFSLLEPAPDVGFQFKESVGGDDRKALLVKGDGHVRFVPWRPATVICGDVLWRSNALQLIATLM